MRAFLKGWAIGLVLIFFMLGGLMIIMPESGFAAATTDPINNDHGRKVRYHDYLAGLKGMPRPDEEIIIRVQDFSSADTEIEILNDFAGKPGESIATGDKGYVEWEVYVSRDGLYNVAITYFPLKGTGSTIVRELQINNQTPFAEAKFFNFFRIWGDVGPVTKDVLGNELRPRQIEKPFWQEVVLHDSRGHERHPLLFHFKEGYNTIRLISHREPMAVASLKLFKAQEISVYEVYKQRILEQGGRVAHDVLVKIQGEHAGYRSNSTLSPVFDQGDPTLYPYHPYKIRLNTIGGTRWNEPGQWIAWEFEVPKTGFYKIAIKAKQDALRGLFVNRRLTINGEAPFKEAEAIRFSHSSNYQMHVVGGDEPKLVYLEKGKHQIRLEVVLGDLATLIRTAEKSLYELNTLYRHIIMITSPNPDPLRDYLIEERLPEIVERFGVQAESISNLAQGLEEYTGQRGGHAITLRNFVRHLDAMAQRPYTIARRLGELRDNLGALGTWVLQTREQPLQIDFIIIASPEKELPRAYPTFMETIMHEIRAFWATFVRDFNVIGVAEAGLQDMATHEPLTVWMGLGRDQAQILRTMIDHSFVPQAEIPVNLQLVNMNILLPAVLAGRGPDIALGVDPSLPLNFAMRGGVVDLTRFKDFTEIAARFKPSAFVPFAFRGGIYALPEQQPFPMLFYRSDILSELGIEIPSTWEDVFKIIPELQKNHMEFGLPFSTVVQVGNANIGEAPAGGGSLSANFGVTTFLMMLNQRGEELFVGDGKRTTIDSQIAYEVFSNWTSFYELFNMPLAYDAANRFRRGEMPLLIATYPLYNLLTVFAPELRGEWSFTLVPGTKRPDGVIDHSVPAAGIASVMLADAGDKEAAWEFLKWWSNADIQLEFGREMEGLMGAAARYPAANIETLELLPWSAEERDKLIQQWKWVTGVPEVPGGYMAGRHLDNAFRRVVFQQAPTRRTLLYFNRIINEEIARKRREVGLR